MVFQTHGTDRRFGRQVPCETKARVVYGWRSFRKEGVPCRGENEGENTVHIVAERVENRQGERRCFT